ncbi:MAG: response regulator transcription factor [Synergistaceae bacterium]|jgi:DNA-binding response OmpR family regulator|nr:response regulator transcription factor [Synergistaceae bacterium]
MSVNLLIVEDEPAIVDVLAAYAEREGYSTRWARDGEEAVEAWSEAGEGVFDLVLLDLMLPRRSGDEVCRYIRARSSVPIVMLTAKGSEADVVSGLDAGADDYVAKPFSPRVLMARIRAHLRKNAAPQLGLKNVLKLGSRVEIDPNRVEIRKDGQPIPVTRNEFLIFSTLAAPPIRTWSRDDIIRTALGDEYDGFDRTVDTYVKNLRKKLAEPGHENGWIQTVHGFGYKIDDSDPAKP